MNSLSAPEFKQQLNAAVKARAEEFVRNIPGPEAYREIVATAFKSGFYQGAQFALESVRAEMRREVVR